MKIIGPIVSLYDEVFKNPTSQSVVNHFNTNEVKCWNALSAQEFSDQEVSDFLYKDKSRQAYNQFKAGFLHKIVAIVINHESDKMSVTQSVHHEIYRGFCAVQILYTLGLLRVAVPLAEKVLSKCKLYNMNSIGRDLATKLANHYKLRDRNPRKEKKYKELSFLMYERVGIEMEADYLNTDIMGSKNPLAHAELAADYVEKLSKYEHVESHRFKLLYYYMKMIASADDKRGIIEVATEALDYFTNLHYDHSIAKNMFRKWLMNTNLQLGNMKEAVVFLNASLDELKPGIQRDMMLMKRVQLHLASDCYPEAKDTLVEISKSTQFRFTNKRIKADYWNLRLYVYLIEQLGFLPAGEVSLRKIKNNLSRNSEENVNQAIAFFLLGVLSDGLDYAIEHEADLDHWIRKDVSVRTKLFLKHLKRLANSKYEVMDMGYMDKLRDERRDLDFSVHMDEVVPYEELWGMVGGCVGGGVRMGDGVGVRVRV